MKIKMHTEEASRTAILDELKNEKYIAEPKLVKVQNRSGEER